MELATLSIMEAAEGIKKRDFSAEDYTRSLLERIARCDGRIQAWAWLDAERALAAARRGDERIREGAARPLEGIPIGVKDIFATAGVPTEMGSPAFAGHVPEKSAKVVELLEDKGAFVLGKTVTTECAFLHPGKTHNPWNPNHTPGGSSSGSAAAVAAGFVPAALGTQTNGSMIRPAAFCGVVGFKPTQGALPIAGALTFSHTLDQPGIFTRTAREAAWLFGILTEDKPLADECRFPPRLAAVRTPVWDLATDAAKEKFRKDLEELRRAGAIVEEQELPDVFALAQGVIRTIMSVEAAFNLEELAANKATFLSATLRDFIAEGNRTAAPLYLKALFQRTAIQEELERFLEGYDAIVTPPATGEAPATLEQTGNPAFCSIWSICGVPAITIPTGLGPQGLPMGLQIVSGRSRDKLALRTACWCEGRFNFPVWRETP